MMGIWESDLWEPIISGVTFVFIIIFIFVCIHSTIWWIKKGKEIVGKRKQWKKEDDLPLSVSEATVVTKRERECLQTSAHKKTTTFIAYRVTFELENGDRKEFSVSLPEYGLITEGDVVQLSFQGARYIKFEKRGF